MCVRACVCVCEDKEERFNEMETTLGRKAGNSGSNPCPNKYISLLMFLIYFYDSLKVREKYQKCRWVSSPVKRKISIYTSYRKRVGNVI